MLFCDKNLKNAILWNLSLMNGKNYLYPRVNHDLELRGEVGFLKCEI